MRRLFYFPALLLPLMALSACEPSQEDYVDNAQLREDKLRECAEMGVMAAKEDTHCQMAMEAQAAVLKMKAGELLDAMTLQQSERNR